jgi:bifunctional DNA-binding transcriptional regulator/antitoxin component of YhaV-PrlF toxin-antitoxin module
LCTKFDQKAAFDLEGKEVFPLAYEELKIWYDYIKAKKGEKYGLYDTEGEELMPCRYEEITYNSRYKFLKIVQDKKIGLADPSGKVIVAPEYSFLKDFDSNNIARIREFRGSWGLINQKGNWILPCEFRSIRKEFYPNFYEVKSDTLYGLVDQKGRTLLPAKYEELHYIYFKPSGFSVDVRRKDYERDIDKKRTYQAEVSEIAQIFVCAKELPTEGHPKRQYKLWRYDLATQELTFVGDIRLDNSSKYKLSFWGDKLIQIHASSFAFVMNENYTKIYDWEKYGQKIVHLDENNHLHVQAGISMNPLFLADVNFTRLSEEYYALEFCENKMYLARDSEGYGYLDTKGQLIIPVKYQEALPFEEDNRALIKQGEKWGVIDQYGAEIIIPIFERIERSNNGFKVFFDEKKVYDVDRNGKCTSKKVKQYNELVKAFYKD